MKLLQLEIEHYGIYSERQFNFDPTGFQLIYGPNEAGKSTLLQLIRETLYGFPVQTPFASKKKSERMQVSGAIGLRDQRQLQFTRKKSRSDSLTGQFADGTPLQNTSQWDSLLGNTDLSMYCRVFGFSQEELKIGEGSLEQSSLDEALFGGGLGNIADFHTLIQRLEEEQKKLFLKTGRNPTINKCLSHLSKLRKEAKQSIVKPDEYHKWTSEFDDLNRTNQQRRGSRAELGKQQGHNQRLLKALPAYYKIINAQKQIDGIKISETFPFEALGQYDRRFDQEKELKSELNELKESLKQAKASVAQIEFNPKLLEHAKRIEQLVQSIEKIRSIRSDLPACITERKREEENALKQLQAIDPTWDFDSFSSIQISLEQREILKSSVTHETTLRVKIDHLTSEVSSKQSELDQASQELTILSDESDSEILKSVLSERSTHERNVEKLDDIHQQLQKGKQTKKSLTRELTPIASSDFLTDSDRSIPLDVEIDQFSSRFSQAELDLSKASEKAVTCKKELTNKQDEFRRLNAGHDIPTSEDLLASRTGRDQTWQQIKDSLLAKEPKQKDVDPAKVSQQFEQEMQVSDSIADQRQKALKVIIQIEELILEIESREKQLESLTQSELEAESALSVIQAEWKSLWQASGIDPQTPKVMQQWANLYRSYLAESQLEITLQAKREELIDAINNFRHKAAEVLGEATIEAESDSNLIRRLDEALDHSRQAKTSRQQLQKQVSTTQSKIDKLKANQELYSAELAQVIDEANLVLQQIPGFQTKNLEIANTIMGEINIVKSQLKAADGLRNRIDAMQSELKQFDTNLRETAELCDESIGDQSVEEAALELHRKFENAKNLDQAQTKLNDQIKRESKQLETLTKQLKACSDQLTQWNKAAEAENASEFNQVAEQAILRKEYEKELRTSERDLALIREAENESAFQDELESTDKHALELENQDLATQLGELDEQIKQTDQSIGALRDKINKSDQSSDTIKLSTEIESLQAEITNHVDQYVPLVFAQQMIEKAIGRFRQKNEGEILASINLLFSELTLGRYRGIDRNHDSAESLVAIDDAGQEKLASELSTGTREQLYLAIRLAYIKHYADKSEPLPVVMDDILVNFDDERQLSTLKVLMNFDPDIQILFLTCHESIVHKAQSIRDNVPLVSLSGDPSPSKPTKKKRKQPKSEEPTLF